MDLASWLMASTLPLRIAIANRRDRVAAGGGETESGWGDEGCVR